MTQRNLRTVAVALAATTALPFLLCSCEGRTMSNMKPTGDTVEVVIENLKEETPQSHYNDEQSATAETELYVSGSNPQSIGEYSGSVDN